MCCHLQKSRENLSKLSAKIPQMGEKNNENSQKKENSFVWQPKPEDSGSNCHASGPGPDVREVGQPVILIINIHLELLVPGI